MDKQKIKSKKAIIPLVCIGVLAAGLVLIFAWSAGLLGNRTTTASFLKDIPNSFPAGYRRAHSKGICFEGTFRSTGKLAPFSKATVFSQDSSAVLGRFSIGTVDPFAADNSTRTVSMAMMISSENNQQWRMKLNNHPFFVTHDALGVIRRSDAYKIDSTTGKPNPALVSAFLKDYPEAQNFIDWADKAPWVNSFAVAEYNVINAFYLIDSKGNKHAVRWSMRPHAPFSAWSKEEREHASHDFLFDDLKQRLDKGALYWDLVMTFAEPGDEIENPSKAWPANRRQIVAGVLEIKRVFDQTEGGCRDINFDPTKVPAGIEVSKDPVLTARAGIYAHSYNARVREIGYGKATDAIGKKETSKDK
ncbi:MULTISPECIES: catalase family peroxidase [Sphingobacterium]|uniref:catalase family peroxidase n=1 Tax=Sphingobacterium TaxID=28453 RepID=UPI001CBED305|nr:MULTISPECIES: catalase family peroxidase [Sphingobacterium]